jgi:hypothetical protein
MADDEPPCVRRPNRTPQIRAFTSKRDLDRLHVAGDVSKIGDAWLGQCSRVTPDVNLDPTS